MDMQRCAQIFLVLLWLVCRLTDGFGSGETSGSVPVAERKELMTSGDKLSGYYFTERNGSVPPHYFAEQNHYSLGLPRFLFALFRFRVLY